MKITDLQAYKRFKENFTQKKYSLGTKSNLPIYCVDDCFFNRHFATTGHYVYAIEHLMIKFEEIPEKHRTRDFFLNALSGVYEELVDFVKKNPQKFDKQFYKDHIATTYYALEFENNDFAYMPIEFIDEEMVMCAMFKAIHARYIDRRDEFDDWFYFVYERKPEVLNYELYVLGARCFASKWNGRNKFLEITPEKYRTREYYFALCLANSTRVMEDIPESILTNQFLVDLLNENVGNIQSFSEEALEREIFMEGKGLVKFWQAAVYIDGYQIGNIPLNDERIEFFLSLFDKKSWEYKYGFKDSYDRYVRMHNKNG